MGINPAVSSPRLLNRRAIQSFNLEQHPFGWHGFGAHHLKKMLGDIAMFCEPVIPRRLADMATSAIFLDCGSEAMPPYSAWFEPFNHPVFNRRLIAVMPAAWYVAIMTGMSYDPLRDILIKKLVLTLVVTAFIGIVVGLSIDSGIIRRWQLERKAAAWTPGPEDSLRPAENLIAPEMNIVGDWVLNGLNYIHLSITLIADDKYRVQVETAGCIGPGKSVERTATFNGGVIKTDKPITEYAPYVYDTIYAVRIGGHDCLVPAARVELFKDALKRDPNRGNYVPFFIALTRDADN